MPESLYLLSAGAFTCLLAPMQCPEPIDSSTISNNITPGKLRERAFYVNRKASLQRSFSRSSHVISQLWLLVQPTELVPVINKSFVIS